VVVIVPRNSLPEFLVQGEQKYQMGLWLLQEAEGKSDGPPQDPQVQSYLRRVCERLIDNHNLGDLNSFTFQPSSRDPEGLERVQEEVAVVALKHHHLDIYDRVFRDLGKHLPIECFSELGKGLAFHRDNSIEPR
jgi:hypothetical protein